MMMYVRMDDDILAISELCGFYVYHNHDNEQKENINQVQVHIPFEPISQHRRPSSTAVSPAKSRKRRYPFIPFHSISRRHLVS
jgi:hypothetical protein